MPICICCKIILPVYLSCPSSTLSNIGLSAPPSVRPANPFFCLNSPADDAICEGVVVPEGGRERNQGYQLRLATAPVLLIDFSLLTLSYAKLEETGKEKEVEEEEKEEKEHGGGVKLTEFASPQQCCWAIFWTFTYGTYKERSPRCSIFP